ncbi:hypothetical protein C1X05_02755 [Laceyella sacchari]|uniref:Uncharacterized protein n=2 Tax=Laceyella TaxID=292635 RepID=A0AA45WIA6_9BACL|nr:MULTISPECIES: hypothetical protein [Laceyella]AUS07850.1 hypothetical protein C1X05_02755 [Laceyella sacchari]PRZ12338.1 hypothetical protein CLV36_1141 [Laceyella sediminis]SMP00309.1 hypothetical protein SAMN06265361_10168 [Laceyella tengchongensis]
MNLEYYKKWNRHYEKPRFSITEDEAKELHEDGKHYVVVIKDKEVIKYVVEVFFNIYFCGVLYYDAQGKVSDSFIKEGNMLF